MAPLKILILKPSSLGDVVHALPVLRLIKGNLPDSQIHWWIDARLASLLEGDPDLTAVHHFVRKGWHAPAGWSHNLRTALRLRRERFDWVLDLQGLARSALFAWLADGGLALGPDSGREATGVFYDRLIARPSPDAHAVDWNLDFVRALGLETKLPFDWLPVRAAVALAVRHQARQSGGLGRWIVFCPGARWENKRWPLEHFRDLAGQLCAADPTLRIAVVGSAEDRPLGAALAGKQVLDLTGQTTLHELIEGLRMATVVVSNDSAPLHLAAAMGRPVVALFGPTNARRTGPYGAPGSALQLRLPCVPCQSRTCSWDIPVECLKALSPGLVATAVGVHLRAAGA